MKGKEIVQVNGNDMDIKVKKEKGHEKEWNDMHGKEHDMKEK